jgi:hypothetical protein
MAGQNSLDLGTQLVTAEAALAAPTGGYVSGE